MIRVEGLTKSFGANQVLRGVDFEAPKATITIVIGRSGGGKSVLLKHLIGLMRPDAGRVLIDGADITRLSGRALEQVELVGVGSKYPAEISGGMRKRVAIARALVTEPEIIFFDEPTTGLDPILVNTIHRLIQSLHRKLHFTAVMVSHEIPEIFEIADRVAMLHEGRIVEAGPPDVIQASTNPVIRQFIRGEPELSAPDPTKRST